MDCSSQLQKFKFDGLTRLGLLHRLEQRQVDNRHARRSSPPSRTSRRNSLSSRIKHICLYLHSPIQQRSTCYFPSGTIHSQPLFGNLSLDSFLQIDLKKKMVRLLSEGRARRDRARRGWMDREVRTRIRKRVGIASARFGSVIRRALVLHTKSPLRLPGQRHTFTVRVFKWSPKHLNFLWVDGQSMVLPCSAV